MLSVRDYCRVRNMKSHTLFCSVIGTALLFLGAQNAAAATFNIPSGDIAALKTAINSANGNNQHNTINLAGGVYAIVFIGDCFGGGSGTHDEHTSSDAGSFVQVAHINASAIGAQESVVSLTEETLQVRAQGTASLDAQLNICGSFAAAHSYGKATIEVATACSFVLGAAISTTTTPPLVLSGCATVYLLERGPEGEKVRAEFFGTETGTVSGILMPGRSYEVGFAAVHSSRDLFTNPGSDSYSATENQFNDAAGGRSLRHHWRRDPPNSIIDIEASPDLAEPFTFLGLAASDATGNFQYFDAEAAMLPKRFYCASYSVAKPSSLRP